jgi:uncharacterized Tic20 family protein
MKFFTVVQFLEPFSIQHIKVSKSKWVDYTVKYVINHTATRRFTLCLKVMNSGHRGFGQLKVDVL